MAASVTLHGTRGLNGLLLLLLRQLPPVSPESSHEEVKMNESTNRLASPLGIDELTASALAAVQGGDLRDAEKSLNELAARNRALLDGGDQTISEALGRQVVVLESLFYRLLLSADKAAKPEITALALKSAFSAQRALLATLGALHQIHHA